MTEFAAQVQQLQVDEKVKGIVLTSGKKEFIVGANLHEIQSMKQDAATIMVYIKSLHSLMRQMEQGGKPIVAAMNGTALGGGMEVALACHYRIAADNPKAVFGFPGGKPGRFVARRRWYAAPAAYAGHSGVFALAAASHASQSQRSQSSGFNQRSGGRGRAAY